MRSLVVLVKRCKRNYGNHSEIFDLSRSLKVIGTDTDQSTTYDFLLAIRSNGGSVVLLPRFRDKQRKLIFFSHRMYLTPPCTSMAFCNDVEAQIQKPGLMSLLECQKQF